MFTANEFQPHMKRGRPTGSTYKNPQTRKELKGIITQTRM